VHRTLLLAIGISVLTVGCGGSSTPKATSASTKPAAGADPVDSEYCQTARKWMVHELNGDGSTFASNPVALRKYWGEWLEYTSTATRQAPAEIRDDWPVAYDFMVSQFTPLLEKYDFDIARMKAEGTAAEIAVGERVDQNPTPEEQRAQDAVRAYEGRVCQTAQPEAADVSFAGVAANKAYCDAMKAANDLAEQVAAKQWSIDAVRAFVTSDELATLANEAKQNAPAEIEADVVADADWQMNQQADVIAKFGYDARKLFLEGSTADRAIFQRSDPAIAEHYARTVAYEEQVCGL
jgi:hypothetical protein